MGDEEIRGGDKLILRGLKFHGFHGVKPEERALGQKFLIDVDAWMDLQAAGKSDCLSDTISYTEIYRWDLFVLTIGHPTFVSIVSRRLKSNMHNLCLLMSCFVCFDYWLGSSNSIVKEIVEGPPQNLLESVAQLIASTTLSNYPQISAVRVKVGKPHVAVHGPLDYLGVEILRHRSSDMPN